MKRVNFIILSISFAFIFLFSGLNISKASTEPKATEPITMVNLAKELIQQDIIHWKVVLAQAIVETGWNFDSYLFKNSNNLVGMRVPATRPSARIGEFKGYSKYATWQDCIKDIKYWQAQNWKGGTRDEYIDLMQRIWAESPDYRAFLYMVIGRIDKMLAQFREKHRNHFNYNVIMAYVQE